MYFSYETETTNLISIECFRLTPLFPPSAVESVLRLFNSSVRTAPLNLVLILHKRLIALLIIMSLLMCLTSLECIDSVRRGFAHEPCLDLQIRV